MKFENRVVVVTGGAGNIGLAVCRRFLAEGAKVALTDRSLEMAEKAVAELGGNNVRPYQIDVKSMENIEAAKEQILKDFGKVDILINNAGAWPMNPLDNITEKEWLDVIDLNLNGTFRVTRVFYPLMKAQRYGRIVNLASIAGEVGLPNYIAYSSSKGGVIVFTKTLAMEAAKYGVTVNCVSPGMVAAKGSDPFAHTKSTWVERRGSADEMAHAITFLAEEESGFITGVDCGVDGGRVLGPRFADVN